jgi:hypothetical protein
MCKQLRAVVALGAVVWVLGVASAAWAQPAPWFWWVSLHDGHKVCAQVMPSAGWRKAEGPFLNPACRPPRAALIHSR